MNDYTTEELLDRLVSRAATAAMELITAIVIGGGIWIWMR